MPKSLRDTASGSNALHQERLILKSATFTAPADAVYLVTAIGPGGSGAFTPASGNGLCATGGGAGGKAAKKVRLAKGDVLTVVIGAGGASVTMPGTNGNAGGTTTINGPGLALTANGGKGGKTRAAGAGTALGAEGGTASGGDENLTGGGSGTATVTATAGSVALTGGGAVAIYEIGYSSGDASSSGARKSMTAGGGVGGRSGSATATSADCQSAPGSALRESPPALNTMTTMDPSLSEYPFGFDGLPAGVNGSLTDRTYQQRVLAPKSGAIISSSNVIQPAGCGSAALRAGSQMRAGLFAGAGPRDYEAGSAYRNLPVCGGGSGGSWTDRSDPGADGCAVIEWFEELQ